MLATRSLGIALPVALSVVLLSLVPRIASAQEECPLGSVEKKENGQTWCEPTICATDTNCATGLVCKPVALCVEIGALEPGAKDAGQKLMVRQRCGVAKACPQNTTCSEASRCVTKAQAEKAGLLTASGPSAAPSSATPSSTAPAKSACGCHTVGGTNAGLGAGGLALLAGLVLVARRRR